MFFCVCLCLHWAFIHLDSSAIVIHSASQSPFIVVTISRIRNHSRGRMLISFPSGSSPPTAVVVRDRSRGRTRSRGRPQHPWPHGTIVVDLHGGSASRNEVKIQTVRPPSVAVSEEAERTSSENSIGPGTQLGLGIVMDSTGKTITVNVLESDKIDEVKAKVHTQTGISLCQKTLIFAGEVLKGGLTVRDYEIGHGNTLFLVDEKQQQPRGQGGRGAS